MANGNYRARTTSPPPRVDNGVEFSGLIQSMLNVISQPISVKPGGYSEDIFLDLTAEEKDQYECLICFLICKEPRQCRNQHLFCSSCIFTWSMSLTSESHAKCPVCRTEGRYQLNSDIDKKLCSKHVKCPETECLWAGKLLDYKWHRRRHDREETRRQPPVQPTRRRVTQSSNRASLSDNIEAFENRLHTRRRNVHDHYDSAEGNRRESLEEVENLSRRLGTVAESIVQLLDNMHHDSRRLQRYVDETTQVLPAVDTTTQDSSARVLLPPSTSSRSESRLERLMAEPIAARNSFVVRPRGGATVSLNQMYPLQDVEQRVQRLLAEPTSSANPFTLPDDLLNIRAPLRSRNSNTHIVGTTGEQIVRQRSTTSRAGQRRGTDQQGTHRRDNSGTNQQKYSSNM